MMPVCGNCEMGSAWSFDTRSRLRCSFFSAPGGEKNNPSGSKSPFKVVPRCAEYLGHILFKQNKHTHTICIVQLKLRYT